MSNELPFELTPVETIDADETFDVASLLHRRKTPLLIKGFASKWPAVKRWSFEFLADHFGDRQLSTTWSPDRVLPTHQPGALDQGRQGLETKSEHRPITARTLFRAMPDPSNLHYLHAFHLREAAPELLADLPFGPAHDPDFEPLLWSSSPGQTKPTHIDGGDGLFVQLRGGKRFILFSPAQFEALYPYGVDHPQALYSRLLALAAPDFERYPKARNLQALEAVIDPGSLLFTPAYWWHNVITDTASVSVNFVLKKERDELMKLLSYWEALHQQLDQTLPARLPPAMRVYALRLLLFPPALSKARPGVTDERPE